MSNLALQGLAAIWFLAYMMRILFSQNIPNHLYIETVIFGFPLLHITILDIPLFVYLTILFLVMENKVKSGKSKSSAITFLLIIFLIIILTGWYTAEVTWKIQNLIELIQWACMIFFTSKVLSMFYLYHEYYFRFLKLIRSILIVSLIILILQISFGMSIYFSTQMNPNVISDDGIRYPSFYSDPQIFAQFLASGCFLMLIPIKNDSNRRVQDWLLYILCIVALMLTGTRSAFLGFSVSVIFLVFRFPGFLKYVVLILMPLLIFMIYKYGDKIILFNRGTDAEEAFLFRQTVWKNAIGIFLQHPLLGIGFGNYADYVTRYYPDQHWMRNGEWVVFDHPESGYLKLLTETGLLGLFCLSALLINIIYTAIRKSIINKTKEYLFYLSSLLAWLIAFYTVYSFSDIRMLLFIGCIVVMLKYQTEKPNEAIS